MQDKVGRAAFCLSALLYQSYKFIVLAFEAIALGLHRGDLSDNYSAATWDPDSKTLCFMQLLLLNLSLAF